MNGLLQDSPYAARQLRRRPGVYYGAVITLRWDWRQPVQYLAGVNAVSSARRCLIRIPMVGTAFGAMSALS